MGRGCFKLDDRGEPAADHPASSTEDTPHSSTYTQTLLPGTSSLNRYTHIGSTTTQIPEPTRAVLYSTIDITTTITLTPTPSHTAQARQTHTRIDDQFLGSQPDYLAQVGADSSDNTDNEMISIVKKHERSESNSGRSERYRKRATTRNQTQLPGSPDADQSDLPIKQRQDIETSFAGPELSEPNKLERRARTVSPVVFNESAWRRY